MKVHPCLHHSCLGTGEPHFTSTPQLPEDLQWALSHFSQDLATSEEGGLLASCSSSLDHFSSLFLAWPEDRHSHKDRFDAVFRHIACIPGQTIASKTMLLRVFQIAHWPAACMILIAANLSPLDQQEEKDIILMSPAKPVSLLIDLHNSVATTQPKNKW